MSAKQTVMGPRGPEKVPGYFSWRHQTSREHTEARLAYQQEHGRAARQRKAKERAAEFEKSVLAYAIQNGVTEDVARNALKAVTR